MMSHLPYLLMGGLLVWCLAAAVEDQGPGAAVDGEAVDQSDETDKLAFVPKYSKLLDANQLQLLKESPSIGTVYFYLKDVHGKTASFLDEYDKSAGFLNAYGLTMGLVDCRVPMPIQECVKADEKKIYTYRNGKSVFELDLDTMFDVNSIMSNILQLALLDEVLIIQNKENRKILEHENAGQNDIIYAYHSAIGTYEHRVFMEIAYAYQDKYKFVVTTELSSIDDLQDGHLITKKTECQMWVLYCQDRYSAAAGCRSVNYRGEINLLALATFFNRLNWPRVVYRPLNSEETHPCDSNDETCVYMYHSAATKDKADAVIESIQFDLHGMAGLIVQPIVESIGDEVRDPNLAIKKPGGQLVFLTQPWQLSNVEVFIASNLLFSSDQEEETSRPADDEMKDDSESDVIDDTVAHVAFQLRNSIANTTNITSLNDKTFASTVKDKSRKFVIVLFYIPFDAQGMLFQIPYQQAAQELAALKVNDPSSQPLMRINCFDWTDICQKENITTYPVLHIYRNGGKREQYRQALDKDALVRTVLLLQAEQPLMLKTAEEVDSFVKGQLPDKAYSVVDNIVLFKPSTSQKEIQAFRKVVKELETQMLFAIVSHDVKTRLLPESGVVHVRLRDQDQPMVTMTEHLDAEHILHFLKNGQFHLFPELTFMNFPALYKRRKPFGILFFDPKSPQSAIQRDAVFTIIKDNSMPDMTFCKMTFDGSNPVASALLLNYTDTAVLPTFAVVNHQKGEVHTLVGNQLGEVSLLSWIQAVQDGTIAPTKMLDEGNWKPSGRHYDFLAKMDQEKKKKKKSSDTSACHSGKCSGVTDPFVMEAQNQKDEQDADIRSNLLDLKQSRLYSSKERRLPSHSADKEKPVQSDDKPVSAGKMEDERPLLHSEL